MSTVLLKSEDAVEQRSMQILAVIDGTLESSRGRANLL
jgi:hypothetical protein